MGEFPVRSSEATLGMFGKGFFFFFLFSSSYFPICDHHVSRHASWHLEFTLSNWWVMSIWLWYGHTITLISQKRLRHFTVKKLRITETRVTCSPFLMSFNKMLYCHLQVNIYYYREDLLLVWLTPCLKEPPICLSLSSQSCTQWLEHCLGLMRISLDVQV